MSKFWREEARSGTTLFAKLFLRQKVCYKNPERSTLSTCLSLWVLNALSMWLVILDTKVQSRFRFSLQYWTNCKKEVAYVWRKPWLCVKESLYRYAPVELLKPFRVSPSHATGLFSTIRGNNKSKLQVLSKTRLAGIHHLSCMWSWRCQLLAFSVSRVCAHVNTASTDKPMLHVQTKQSYRYRKTYATRTDKLMLHVQTN